MWGSFFPATGGGPFSHFNRNHREVTSLWLADACKDRRNDREFGDQYAVLILRHWQIFEPAAFGWVSCSSCCLAFMLTHYINDVPGTVTKTLDFSSVIYGYCFVYWTIKCNTWSRVQLVEIMDSFPAGRRLRCWSCHLFQKPGREFAARWTLALVLTLTRKRFTHDIWSKFSSQTLVTFQCLQAWKCDRMLFCNTSHRCTAAGLFVYAFRAVWELFFVAGPECRWSFGRWKGETCIRWECRWEMSFIDGEKFFWQL